MRAKSLAAALLDLACREYTRDEPGRALDSPRESTEVDNVDADADNRRREIAEQGATPP
ncbi:MAG: hypothetical protein PSX37_09655 [bacterium]|nr:hypothetical protein [bacterium]